MDHSFFASEALEPLWYSKAIQEKTQAPDQHCASWVPNSVTREMTGLFTGRCANAVTSAISVSDDVSLRFGKGVFFNTL